MGDPWAHNRRFTRPGSRGKQAALSLGPHFSASSALLRGSEHWPVAPRAPSFRTYLPSECSVPEESWQEEMEKVRIVILRFGTARQKRVLE
jgi:hypothetical protein